MSYEGVDLGGSLGLKLSGRFTQRARRITHIIDDDADFVLHVAHDDDFFDLVGFFSFFVHHGEANLTRMPPRFKILMKLLGPLDRTGIWCDYAELGFVYDLRIKKVDGSKRGFEIVPDCLATHSSRRCNRVEIERDDFVYTHELEHLRHIDRRHRHLLIISPLRSCVAIIWYDCVYAAATGAFACRHHQNQEHHVVVDGLAGGLDEVHVFPLDISFDFHEALAVSEVLDGCVAELGAEVFSHS